MANKGYSIVTKLYTLCFDTETCYKSRSLYSNNKKRIEQFTEACCVPAELQAV